MLKRIGLPMKTSLSTALTRLQQIMRPVLKVKLTRHYLCISLPLRFGGDFHLLHRKELAGPWRFTVAPEGPRFFLQMIDAANSKLTLAHFPDEATARLALTKLSQAFSEKHMTKWLWRLSLLCLIGWWIGYGPSSTQRSYTQALLTDRSNATALPIADLQPPASLIDNINPAHQTSETNELTKVLSQQIITAQASEKYARLASPNQYESEVHSLTPNSDLSEINQLSAKCDPKFAFEVAQP